MIDSTDAITSTFLHSFDKHNFDFKGSVKDIIKEIGYPLDIMFEKLEFEVLFEFLDSYKIDTRYFSSSKQPSWKML